MIFPKELSMVDITIGLLALADHSETDEHVLFIQKRFMDNYDHHTAFEGATDIAMQNGLQLVVEELSLPDFLHTPAFAFGKTENQGWICGLSGVSEEGYLLMPNCYENITEMPEFFTVLRSRPVTLN